MQNKLTLSYNEWSNLLSLIFCATIKKSNGKWHYRIEGTFDLEHNQEKLNNF